MGQRTLFNNDNTVDDNENRGDGCDETVTTMVHIFTPLTVRTSDLHENEHSDWIGTQVVIYHFIFSKFVYIKES